MNNEWRLLRLQIVTCISFCFLLQVGNTTVICCVHFLWNLLCFDLNSRDGCACGFPFSDVCFLQIFLTRAKLIADSFYFPKVLQQPPAGTWLYTEKGEEEKEWSHRGGKGQASDGCYGLQSDSAPPGLEDAQWTGRDVPVPSRGSASSPLPGGRIRRPLCFQWGGWWPEERGNSEEKVAEQVGSKPAAPERDRDFKSSPRAL